MTLVAAVALSEAVETFAPGLATIKWPNDLLIGRAKLSGILLERGSADALIIGFGVNLATHPDLADRPTTSLAEHGVVVTPAALLDVLREKFALWLSRWRDGDLPGIRDAWEASAHPRGTMLRVRLPDGGEMEGAFDGLDAGGALRLLDRDGRVTLIHAGDVFA